MEIALDDSLEHCLTTSRGKTQGKNLGGPSLGSKLGFSLIFPRYFLEFSLILHKIAAWDNV